MSAKSLSSKTQMECLAFFCLAPLNASSFTITFYILFLLDACICKCTCTCVHVHLCMYVHVYVSVCLPTVVPQYTYECQKTNGMSPFSNSTMWIRGIELRWWACYQASFLLTEWSCQMPIILTWANISSRPSLSCCYHLM